jgi:hypothetical protein
MELVKTSGNFIEKHENPHKTAIRINESRFVLIS